MTGINPVGAGMAMENLSSSSGSRLKALEQKLAQLKREKSEAVQDKNKEKERELEKQIQKVEQQIQQLKKKEEKNNKKKENEPGSSGYGAGVQEPFVGNLIDRYG